MWACAHATGGFNPRLRMGGDGRQYRQPETRKGFNPRLRMGGDDERFRIFAFIQLPSFNPRLRMGGDILMPRTIHLTCSNAPFQSTPPHGRRPGRTCTVLPSMPFQSSASAWDPTHWGRHWRRVDKVSIHGSASGGDAAMLDPASPRQAFQSTPPHGRRPGLYYPTPHGSHRRFNPRLRMGGDAPRSPHRPYEGNSRSFQSTPPHGRRRSSGRYRTIRRRRPSFQSTPPHGRRPTCRAAVSGRLSRACFNPRLRMGGDKPRRAGSGGIDLGFQSTPPHGRRLPSVLPDLPAGT